MANLKIKKTDLKGHVEVGHGWLVCNAWAVKVGDDKRFVDKATLDAAFAKLDSGTLARAQAEYLSLHAKTPIMNDGYHRTNLLLEGEDGVLCRLYRAHDNQTVALNEDYCRILGDPPQMVRSATVFTCGTGVIAPTTDQPPPWVREMF